MTLKERFFNKKFIKEFLLINIGVFLTAFSFSFFLDANNLVFGGVSGIGIIIRNLFGDTEVPTSVIIFVINMLLLVISFFALGKNFFVKTIYGSLMFPVYSFLVEITIPKSIYPSIVSDPLVIIVAAAVITGIGLGLALKYGASTGGVDILQSILLKYCKVPLSVSLIIIDGVIMVIGAFSAFNELGAIYVLLYGILYIAISGYLMDNIVFGGFNVRAVYIVTSKPKEIKEDIFVELNRGVTELHSRGGYTGNDQVTLLCVLTTREYYYLRSIALKIDPAAFIFVTKASEVHGEGFTYESEDE